MLNLDDCQDRWEGLEPVDDLNMCIKYAQKNENFRHVQKMHEIPYQQSLYTHSILTPYGSIGGVRCSVIQCMTG